MLLVRPEMATKSVIRGQEAEHAVDLCRADVPCVLAMFLTEALHNAPVEWVIRLLEPLTLLFL